MPANAVDQSKHAIMARKYVCFNMFFISKAKTSLNMPNLITKNVSGY